MNYLSCILAFVFTLLPTFATEKEFLMNLTAAGQQKEAVKLGRKDPEAFLELLSKKKDEIPTPFLLMVESDLRAAMGDEESAKRLVQDVAKIAQGKNGEWKEGGFPKGAFLRDPPPHGEDSKILPSSGPWVSGWERCGSQRDNWLIRRAMKYELPEIVEQEFARVWDDFLVHTKPHVVESIRMEDGAEKERAFLWRDGYSFSDSARRFALDYAIHLQAKGEHKKSLAVLREVIWQLDFEEYAKPIKSRPATDEEIQNLPRHRATVDYGLKIWEGAPFRRGNVGVYDGEGIHSSLLIDSSPPEFLRLAYGFFKEAGQDEKLAEDLEEQIIAGENDLRRVLARIHLHEGRVEKFVDLELEYYQKSDLKKLNQLLGIAQVYQKAGKAKEAIKNYERALEIREKEAAVPQAHHFVINPLKLSTHGILAQLSSLYQSEGQAGKAFVTSLRLYEYQNNYHDQIERLERLAKQAERLQMQDAYKSWSAEFIKSDRAQSSLAAIHWVEGDFEKCAEFLANQFANQKEASIPYFDIWQKRFRAKGRKLEEMFLNSILEKDSEFLAARIARWKYSPDLSDEQKLTLLEDVLNSNEDAFFESPGYHTELACFRNRYHLAEELFRHAHKMSDIAKVKSVGLQLAKEEAPFGNWSDQGFHESYPGDSEGLVEDLSACLAWLIQNLDRESLLQIEKLWASHPDHPPKRQLSLRLGKETAEVEEVSIAWGNLPEDARVFVSPKTVLSVAWAEGKLVTGHPWGVLLWNENLTPAEGFAFPEPARELVVHDGTIWAGSETNLYRLEPETGQLARISILNMNDARPAKIKRMAVVGNHLWIGVDWNIKRLNLETMQLRNFSERELKLDGWEEFSMIIPDGDLIWFSGREVTRCYEIETDQFHQVKYQGREVPLIGVIDGQVFGMCHINDRLQFRPGIIDRETLQVQPIFHRARPGERMLEYGREIFVAGEFEEKVVFSLGRRELYQFLPEANELMSLPPDSKVRTILPMEAYNNAISPSRKMRSGEIAGKVTPDEPLELQMTPTQRLFILPGGQMLSARSGWGWEFDDTLKDANAKAESETSRGLFLRDQDDWKSIFVGQRFKNLISGDRVHDIAKGENCEKWLCTNFGISVLNNENEVVREFTQADGLLSNWIMAGARTKGGILFQDHKGEVMKYDFETKVFSRSNQALRKGNQLNRFEPKMNFGGVNLMSEEFDSRVYLGMTRGLVISNKDGSFPQSTVTDRHLPWKNDPHLKLEKLAEEMKIRLPSLEEAMELAVHENPYVALRLTYALPPYVSIKEPEIYLPVWRRTLQSPLDEVKIQSLQALARWGENRDQEIIRPLLKNRNQKIRDYALLALIQAGEIPAIEALEEYSERPGNTRTHFTGTSLQTALAPVANREVFKLFMKHPASVQWEDPINQIIKPLGKSLRKYPEAAEDLLLVNSPKFKGSAEAVAMVREIFGYAGPQFLPRLHRALESKDRVLRSNAALACGAIGDPSSIPHLIKSLERESALSRASSVASLGDLKAREALPRLYSLYQNLPDPFANSSGLAAQNAFVVQLEIKAAEEEEFDESLSEIERFRKKKNSNWREREVLLNREVILTALEKIGPEHSQEFYRKLVTEGQQNEREKAALWLGFAGPQEREKSLTVLKSLQASNNDDIRHSAGISIRRLESQKEE